MAIDTTTLEGQWFQRLAKALHERRVGRYGGQLWDPTKLGSNDVRPGLDLLDAYRRGDPPLNKDIHAGWKPYIRRYIRMGRLNVAGLIVTSTSNRMQLRDFRTAAAGDELGDQIVRDIMRANGASLVDRETHDSMISLGDGYQIVTPPSGDEKFSRYTDEDPREVITAHDPVTGEVRAALKMFRDEWDGEDIAYLYLPGIVRKARKKGSSTITRTGFRMSRDWTFLDDDEPVPGNEIPVVRFRNRDGVGDFEYHLDSLDRINDKIFNEWWIGKIQAFRQRAVKNLPDEDEETGEEIDYTDMFTASPDEMWQVPGDVDFWESTPVDMNPIVNSIQKDLERLAAVLSNPLHTITPDAADGSAEGASTMKEEHTYKVEDRILRVNPAHAKKMYLALLFQGETQRADVTKLEPIWGPIERYSLAQRSDAASKLKGILPDEAIYTDVLQYAPAEVPNLRALRGRDLIFQAPSQTPRQA